MWVGLCQKHTLKNIHPSQIDEAIHVHPRVCIICGLRSTKWRMIK